MQLITVVCALLASTASARVFTLYSDINYWGTLTLKPNPTMPTAVRRPRCNSRRDLPVADKILGNLNGKGDTTSSVGGDSGCTTFYRERDCSGSSWQQRGDAFTVPGFLNDHIYSFRNQC